MIILKNGKYYIEEKFVNVCSPKKGEECAAYYTKKIFYVIKDENNNIYKTTDNRKEAKEILEKISGDPFYAVEMWIKEQMSEAIEYAESSAKLNGFENVEIAISQARGSSDYTLAFYDAMESFVDLINQIKGNK